MLQIEELEPRYIPSAPVLGPALTINKPELPAINAPQYASNLEILATLRQQLRNDSEWYGQLAIDQTLAKNNMTTIAIHQSARDLAMMRLGMHITMRNLAIASAEQMVATANYNAFSKSTDNATKLFFARRCNAAVEAEKAALTAAQRGIYAEDNWGSAAQSLLENYVD